MENMLTITKITLSTIYFVAIVTILLLWLNKKKISAKTKCV